MREKTTIYAVLFLVIVFLVKKIKTINMKKRIILPIKYPYPYSVNLLKSVSSICTIFTNKIKEITTET